MSKRLRSRNKQKKDQAFLEYGNPDVCVTVRLLPPSLSQDEFHKQAEEHAETLKAGFRELYYQKGTRDVKAFEKPAFSVAQYEFGSPVVAAKVREQLHGKVFHEPETDDNMACVCVKPIVGVIPVAPVPDTEKIDHGAIFDAFCKLRKESDRVLVLELLKSIEKQKKQGKKKKKTPVDGDLSVAASSESASTNNKKPKQKKGSEKSKDSTSLNSETITVPSIDATKKKTRTRKKKNTLGTVEPTTKPQEAQAPAAASPGQDAVAKPKRVRKRKPKKASAERTDSEK